MLNSAKAVVASLLLIAGAGGWSLAGAQTILVKTENYPPFNMEGENGAIIGISTEIVNEMFARAGVDYEMELLPWQRAFSLALENDNTAVFSTTRTEERERKFRWVGPLVENNWVFLAKGSREIEINSLEEARAWRVGGYQGDAVALYLESQGFDLDLAPRDDLNALKIDRDRLDLWASGHLLGPFYAMQQDVSGLEPVFTFRETIMSLAFNINTDDAIIENLQRTLDQMREEGFMDEVMLKYQ